MFRFSNHTLKFKVPDQPQSTGERQYFDTWYYIITCTTLCVSFSSKAKAINVFPKHILKSKARDHSNQTSKKLFCHVIIKNYLSNVSWKFLIKIESTWRREIKDQAPQLPLCTVVGLSEATTGGVIKKTIIFKNLQTFRPAALLKRDPNTSVFLWILQNI